MLTVLSTILGFLGSSLPKILEFLRNKQDNRQELAILDKQLELIKVQGHTKIAEITAQSQADLNKAAYQLQESAYDFKDFDSAAHYKSRWINALLGVVNAIRGITRPGITWLCLAATIYCIVKQISLPEYLWSIDGAIIGFWFGQRAFVANKRKI